MYSPTTRRFSPNRRRFAVLPAVLLLAMATPALASTFSPDKPVRILVPAAPGGITDTVSRLIGPLLSEQLKTPVIIENIPGAGGTLTIRALLRAEPDGHTIAMGSTGPNAINYSLLKDLAYAPEDMTPVSHVISLNNVLVTSPKVGVKTLAELVELSKTAPKGISMGVTTIGSSGHLTGELVKSTVGFDATNITYKGSSPAQIDLIAGRIEFMVDNLSVALPQIESGNLVALATTTAQRLPQIPDVPTIEESGYAPIDASAWLGLFLPAKTPQPIVDEINSAVQKALENPDIQKRFADFGGNSVPGTSADFTQFVNAEIDRWGKVIREGNITVE